MHHWRLGTLPSAPAPAQLFVLLLMLSLLCVAAEEETSQRPSYYYDQCAPAACGASVLRWPFGTSPLCRSAAISVSCVNSTVVITPDATPDRSYAVIGPLDAAAYARRSVRVADQTLRGCGEIPNFPGSAADEWLSFGSISTSPGYFRETVYNCSSSPASSPGKPAICLDCGPTTNNSCYFYDGYGDELLGCRSFRINIPAEVYRNLSRVGNLRRELEDGFGVQWVGNCGESCVSATGGRCGYMDERRQKGTEVCFCSSSVHRYNCSDGSPILTEAVEHGSPGLLIIILATTLPSLLLLVSACYALHLYRKSMNRKESRGKEERVLRMFLDSRVPPSIESFLENFVSGMPTRFSFKEIKKYTNNFSHKLGQGGFGSVFKATLSNGCIVAVKLLDETVQSELQFLNEVQTIGRIHHEHLVRLLGYCFEQSRRALVYEYMEKGSLDKYIHKSHPDLPERLTLSQLHAIALGTAKGIAYLHEECRIRILHFDIKPHNILLDDKFHPKVADFGLAQMLNREHSHISLAGGRGTPGYAPPEMWWKGYGPISEKCDVYSFGMVILEMVGRRRNFEDNMSKLSQTYFPEWAFQHLVKEDSSKIQTTEGQQELKEDEELQLSRMMILVGLWCIQYMPSQRPSMRKVIEMLEGNMAIENPPSPFDAAHGFCGPSNQLRKSSNT